MDPDAPPRVRDSAREEQSLTNVQRWVVSVLAVSTVVHLVLGLLLAAVVMEDPRPGARVGLCVISGGFGVVAVVLARAIHGRSAVSPWLLLGLVPAVVGVWFVST